MNDKDNEMERNRPSEKGRNNDTHIRDYSGIQPGTNTISSSDTDGVNHELTRTASDDFRTENFEEGGADRTFDEKSQLEGDK